LKARKATLHITVAKGGPRQVPRLPSLKHTTVYNLTMILYENMKPIEHVLLHPICVLSHLMCARKHFNVNYLDITEHIEVVDEFITSKIADITWFFIITKTHRSTKKRIWMEKPSVRALVPCAKTFTPITWSEHLKIYCPVIVKQ